MQPFSGRARYRTLAGAASFCLAILLTVIAVPSVAFADASSCATGNHLICLDLTHRPAAGVPVSSADSPSFVAYRAVVRNAGRPTATHVRLVDNLPAGSTPVSVTSTAGACTPPAATVTCDLGKLKAGQSAQVEIVVQAPASPGTIVNAAQVTFDEGMNDADRSKQDTVPADGPLRDATTVSVPSGSTATWVPADRRVSLPTDVGAATATAPITGVAGLPAQAAGYEAALARTPGPDFVCPPYQVCRSGGWIQATVDGGRTFDTPLEFALRWDASVVPPNQSIYNLVVFYQETLTSPVQIISKRCTGPVPTTPCLKDVARQYDGDFTAVLVQNHNGYMR